MDGVNSKDSQGGRESRRSAKNNINRTPVVNQRKTFTQGLNSNEVKSSDIKIMPSMSGKNLNQRLETENNQGSPLPSMIGPSDANSEFNPGRAFQHAQPPNENFKSYSEISIGQNPLSVKAP